MKQQAVLVIHESIRFGVADDDDITSCQLLGHFLFQNLALRNNGSVMSVNDNAPSI